MKNLFHYLAYYGYEKAICYNRVASFDLSRQEVKDIRETLHLQRIRKDNINSRPDNKETFAVSDDDGNVLFIQFYDFKMYISRNARPNDFFGPAYYQTQELYENAESYLSPMFEPTK